MSNSFNISVKPEIAALETKIDTVDTVVDNIRSTDVPNIQTNINVNETKIDIIDAIVDYIQATDLPTIMTAVTTVDSVVDAIKLKTDATPQIVRGSIAYDNLSTSNSSYQDVTNITGQGKLHTLIGRCGDAADTIQILLTIDAYSFAAWTFTGDALYHCLTIGEANNLYLITNNLRRQINLEFDTSLRIQVRRSGGVAANVECMAYYLLDDF